MSKKIFFLFIICYGFVTIHSFPPTTCVYTATKLLCCQIPIPEMMNEHYKTCNEEVQKKENVLTSFSKQWCIDECIFKKYGFIEEKTLNETLFLETIIDIFNGTKDHWLSLFKTSFDYCSTEALAKENDLIVATNKKPFELEKAECSPVTSFIIKCMEVYLTKACPEKHWFPSLDCERYKHYLERCPNQFPPPEYL